MAIVSGVPVRVQNQTGALTVIANAYYELTDGQAVNGLSTNQLVASGGVAPYVYSKASGDPELTLDTGYADEAPDTFDMDYPSDIPDLFDEFNPPGGSETTGVVFYTGVPDIANPPEGLFRATDSLGSVATVNITVTVNP